MRLLPLVFFPGILSAQCPNTSSPHFSCTSAGGNTQITLFADTDISWDSFNVPVNGALDISGEFSSRHLVGGRATIGGDVTADGPFTLVAPRGIVHGGTITAPSVILSTHPAVGPETYQGGERSRGLDARGSVVATSGDVTLIGKDLRMRGALKAPEGKVTLISTASETVSGPDFQRSPGPRPPARFAQSTTVGDIEAPVVEIYAEGTLTNGGRIAGETVILEAQGRLVHQDRPGSIIETGNLLPAGLVFIEGKVINPDEGNNPGGVSTTLGFPDLESGSFTGKKKTRLLPTQYSSSNVSRSRLPSAVSLKKRPASRTRVATRGSTSRKGRKSKKRSFFGIVTRK